MHLTSHDIRQYSASRIKHIKTLWKNHISSSLWSGDTYGCCFIGQHWFCKIMVVFVLLSMCWPLQLKFLKSDNDFCISIHLSRKLYPVDISPNNPYFRFFKARSYLTSFTTAKLWWYLIKMNMIKNLIIKVNTASPSTCKVYLAKRQLHLFEVSKIIRTFDRVIPVPWDHVQCVIA